MFTYLKRLIARKYALVGVICFNIVLFTYIYASVKQEAYLAHVGDVQHGSDVADSYDDGTTLATGNTERLKSRLSRLENVLKHMEDKENLQKDSARGEIQAIQHRQARGGAQIVTSGPVPIILLTYMRSGSSFVGDLLKAGADTFYSFEPMHALQFTIRGRKPLVYLDGNSQSFGNFLDAAVPTVRDLVTCQFPRLPVSLYEDGFFPYGTGSSVFGRCNGGRWVTDLSKARACAKLYNTECTKSKFFVAKIIRIPMYSLEPLMKLIPNLKIIHLLRDPRATTLSQLKAGIVKPSYLRENVTKYCNRVYDDVVKAEDFNRKFPGRLMAVQYEDIVQNPEYFTRQMYEFAGIKYTAKVSTAIRKLTASTDKRPASALRASEWRAKVDLRFINTVDTYCAQLYTKLGYRTIHSLSDLRNPSYSLRGKLPPLDDFRFA